jgi:predicted kinase
MNKSLLICTVGLPRSGKSTWAQAFAAAHATPVVNPDSIRLALHGQPFVAAAEPFVWAIAKVMVHSLFQAGHATVILDATNTTKKRRDEWLSKRWATVFHRFDTPQDVCEIRAMESGRPDMVPIIQKMAAEFEPLDDTEQAAQFMGATGAFPDGQIEPDDQGELVLTVAADPGRNLVHVDFGTLVSWMALPKEQCLLFADVLQKNALKLP